jgi:sugar O-acyltransferase (sialic acid O-acetyltransferase NeuD family)
MFFRKKNKQLILWGATGQAIVLEEFIHKSSYKLISIFDNNNHLSSPVANIPIYYGKNGFLNWLHDRVPNDYHYLIAIGGWNGKIRLEIDKFLKNHGLNTANAIHPSAYISKNAHIGSGSQILGSSFIGARVFIGNQVIVNSSSSIDHECVLSDGVHVAPGATLAGCVEIGYCSFIGTGASILPRIKIGKNVIIGAGSIITKSIPDDVIVYGNPGRIIKNNK